MKRREELKPKKKKKKIDTDVLIVLGVFGSVILIAVIMAFFQSGQEGNTISGNLGNGGQAQQSGDTVKLVLTCAFFVVFLVCLFVIKSIRDKKRKRLLEEREKQEKLQKLEEARERVRRAKLDEFMQYGNAELEKRKREEELLRRSARRNQDIPRNYTTHGEYRRRDLNQFKEEDFELDYEELNWFQRLVYRIKSFFIRDEE